MLGLPHHRLAPPLPAIACTSRDAALCGPYPAWRNLLSDDVKTTVQSWIAETQMQAVNALAIAQAAWAG
jgi:hypothetical protein